jgi:FkbH-like protein
MTDATASDARSAVTDLLLELDKRPTAAAYAGTARRLQDSVATLHPVRIALLSSFTIEPIVPYLECEMARRGCWPEIYVGPFNSVGSELLDPDSGCASFDPDVVLVVQLLDDVSTDLTRDFLELTEQTVDSEVERVVDQVISQIDGFLAQSGASVVLHNFPAMTRPVRGIYDVHGTPSQGQMISRLNRRIAESAPSRASVHVLDFDRACADVGYRRSRNEKGWHMGRIALSPDAMRELALVQATHVQALLGGSKKCLVLDLDDTLWGGIVGEDGLGGIGLGAEFPGSQHVAFQRAVLNLNRQGIILALNSKNNFADVEDVFLNHPDMVLSLEHFSAVRVNWQDKSTNMLEIAMELNIGTDSLVFFDDNPVERAIMRGSLPQVVTIEVPKDPGAYVSALLSGRWFERLAFTQEDRNRNQMYRAQRERDELRQSSPDVSDYLMGLQMSLEIQPCNQYSFPRVHALLHKTNQFNLTSRRHSESVLQQLVQDPGIGVFTARVRDRFGDSGIVGVAIVRMEGETVVIDTLLLSCRVIGRGVETAILSDLASWGVGRGGARMVGDFVPTEKNAPAAGFYGDHGFQQVGESSVEAVGWEVSMEDRQFAWPAHLARKVGEQGHRS